MGVIYLIGILGIVAILFYIGTSYSESKEYSDHKMMILCMILNEKYPLKSLSRNSKSYSEIAFTHRNQSVNKDQRYFEHQRYLNKRKIELVATLKNKKEKESIEKKMESFKNALNRELHRVKILCNKIEFNNLMYKTPMEEVLENNSNMNLAEFSESLSLKMNKSLMEVNVIIEECADPITGILSINEQRVKVAFNLFHRENRRLAETISYKISLIDSIDLDKDFT